LDLLWNFFTIFQLDRLCCLFLKNLPILANLFVGCDCPTEKCLIHSLADIGSGNYIEGWDFRFKPFFFCQQPSFHATEKLQWSQKHFKMCWSNFDIWRTVQHKLLSSKIKQYNICWVSKRVSKLLASFEKVKLTCGSTGLRHLTGT